MTRINGLGGFVEALVSGYLWENIWPESLFILLTVVDARIIMPFFVRIPERRKLDQ